jgi:FixJ family two-component response regulator
MTRSRPIREPVALIVEDDELLARSLARQVRHVFCVRLADRFDQAHAILKEEEYLAAVILDVSIPGGSGLDLLPALTKRNRKCPMLVMTAWHNDEYVAKAQEFGAEFLFKPNIASGLSTFLQRAIILTPPKQVWAALDATACACRFTARELEMTRLALLGFTRTAMAERLLVSENTVKTWRGNVLRKTGKRSLAHFFEDLVEHSS